MIKSEVMYRNRTENILRKNILFFLSITRFTAVNSNPISIGKNDDAAMKKFISEIGSVIGQQAVGSRQWEGRFHWKTGASLVLFEIIFYP